MAPDFHAKDLSIVAFAAAVDAIAPSTPYVDVVVTVRDARAEQFALALGYVPSGIILRGAQTIRRGERRVFRHVPRAFGSHQELVIATSTPAQLEVEVLEAGAAFAADSIADKAKAAAAKIRASAMRVQLAPETTRAIDEIRAGLKLAVLKAGAMLGVTDLAGRSLVEMVASVTGKLEASYRAELAIASSWLAYADVLETGHIPSDWEGVANNADLDARVREFVELGPKLIDAFDHIASTAGSSTLASVAVATVRNLPHAAAVVVQQVRETAKDLAPALGFGALLVLGVLILVRTS